MAERRPGRVVTPGVVLRLVVLLAALSVVSAAAAAPADDAAVREALASRDVYASVPELGDFAGVVEERLATKVAQLEEKGFAVKLALVAPLRGQDPFAYAASLRSALGFEGTLVVTDPRGPVGAAGPRAPDSMRGAFAAAEVDAITSPTQRLIAASDLAVPPPPESGSGWREVLVLMGLALLGGAWAIAWGLRREQRRARAAFAESRAVLKVGLDALRGRAIGLLRRPAMPVEARGQAESALAAYAEGIAILDGATSTGELDGGLLALRRGLAALSRAGEMIGEPQPMDAPFLGLCAADPGHGPATTTAMLADLPARVPVCDQCRRNADSGSPPHRRLVPVNGRPTPFDEADIRYPPLPG